jgi:hypothetical protein
MDDTFLLLFNADPRRSTSPCPLHAGPRWELVLDTRAPEVDSRRRTYAARELTLEGRSVMVLRRGARLEAME